MVHTYSKVLINHTWLSAIISDLISAFFYPRQEPLHVGGDGGGGGGGGGGGATGF